MFPFLIVLCLGFFVGCGDDVQMSGQQQNTVNLETTPFAPEGKSGRDIRVKDITPERTWDEKLDGPGSNSTQRIDGIVRHRVVAFINSGENDIVSIEYFRDKRGLLRSAHIFYRVKK